MLVQNFKVHWRLKKKMFKGDQPFVISGPTLNPFASDGSWLESLFHA